MSVLYFITFPTEPPPGLTTEILGMLRTQTCTHTCTYVIYTCIYMCWLLPSPSPTVAIIIVCSVLGVVFIALAGAAVALIVYILTFTRTETIAHRRLRTENQPVTYRCAQEGGGTCVRMKHALHMCTDRPMAIPEIGPSQLAETCRLNSSQTPAWNGLKILLRCWPAIFSSHIKLVLRIIQPA